MPVTPSSPTLLHVYPPDPTSAWLGAVEHTVAPGQVSVTLVLERLPRGSADLEVVMRDAAGAPLDAKRVALTRDSGLDGLEHPATATIGLVTASDLHAGAWTLLVEPAHGCEVVVHFQVAGDRERVQLEVQQAESTTIDGVLVFEPPDRRPDEIVVGFGTGQQARFVAAEGQEAIAGGHALRIRPAANASFRVDDVDPSRPIVLSAAANGVGGEVEVGTAASGPVRVTLPVRPLATVRLVSAAPFAGCLLLQFRRGGGAWGDPQRVLGLTGETRLLELPVPAGSIEWRLRLPTSGADNRTGARWHEGRLELVPGGTAEIRVPR
jgi:hypothetical protein